MWLERCLPILGEIGRRIEQTLWLWCCLIVVPQPRGHGSSPAQLDSVSLFLTGCPTTSLCQHCCCWCCCLSCCWCWAICPLSSSSSLHRGRFCHSGYFRYITTGVGTFGAGVEVGDFHSFSDTNCCILFKLPACVLFCDLAFDGRSRLLACRRCKWQSNGQRQPHLHTDVRTVLLYALHLPAWTEIKPGLTLSLVVHPPCQIVMYQYSIQDTSTGVTYHCILTCCTWKKDLSCHLYLHYIL